MTFKTSKVFWSNQKVVSVEIGQHFVVDGKKGHAVNLGRKYVEVLIYGGPRVKIDPTIIEPMATVHN